jgi:hypothetical protein
MAIGGSEKTPQPVFTVRGQLLGGCTSELAWN